MTNDKYNYQTAQNFVDDPHLSETLHRIFYIIDSIKGETEELEIADLDELYDFILIDEEV